MTVTTPAIEVESGPRRVAGNPREQSDSSRPRSRGNRCAALQQAATLLREHRCTAVEYARLVHLHKPVRPYEHVPECASRLDLNTAVDAPKACKVWAAAALLAPGDIVGTRLDIPAFTRHGVWAISVHQAATAAVGRVVSYESCIALSDVTFFLHQQAALKIAAGAPKAPMAVIRGRYEHSCVEAAARQAAAALVSPRWVQVGMDPERHSYFYDRHTMRPVVAARRVVQVGPLALALEAEFDAPSNFLF